MYDDVLENNFIWTTSSCITVDSCLGIFPVLICNLHNLMWVLSGYIYSAFFIFVYSGKAFWNDLTCLCQKLEAHSHLSLCTIIYLASRTLYYFLFWLFLPPSLVNYFSVSFGGPCFWSSLCSTSVLHLWMYIPWVISFSLMALNTICLWATFRLISSAQMCPQIQTQISTADLPILPCLIMVFLPQTCFSSGLCLSQ